MEVMTAAPVPQMTWRRRRSNLVIVSSLAWMVGVAVRFAPAARNRAGTAGARRRRGCVQSLRLRRYDRSWAGALRRHRQVGPPPEDAGAPPHWCLPPLDRRDPLVG